MNSKKRLFAKFLEGEILLEQGRLLFSLLNAFASEGYQISFFNNLSNKELKKYGGMALSLKNLTLTEMPPSNTESWIYLFDKEDRVIGNHFWHKKVQVRYDIFSSYWFKQPIIMPFPVHPVHATSDLEQRLKKYRSIEKSIRIFFSGVIKNYTQNYVQYPKPKLPRLKIINTILERMDDDVLMIRDLAFLNSLTNASYIKKCVVVDTNKIWVSDKKWLENLSRSDFFLSPPGIVMPMCHNVIEAMAVGSIPITNYPEWFDPSLKHMENCIVFDDRDDLINKLNFALEMSQEMLAEMRANVLNYYESYLSPDTFVRRIESNLNSKTTILLITESNMAHKPSRLNKNSILIRGTTSSSDKGWIKWLSPAVFRQQQF